ncbi:hypothetical protein DXC78_04015 [Faecalicoccus pleomorphus]|uniref:Transcriptional regulator n=1 Tax=Faecalicoccus pleomorphus TaxID=1323 RepID=A0A3E3E6W5_9FIRM|nr:MULTISPECIES: PAS domain-containing protein [Faecalicoccus]MDB7989850.1 PAS domain-containing protein [Faecalicoccus pleomorphus]MDB7994143.1 PAS domain-containing protein [Faecalicoccus pleomorphus]MDY5110080.1 PAS domain-containing protein [Faecalicoccus sp.]RGD77100.1 hypothetical protein DXC78_04015 [Faecalicoccus pleomorphus]
MKRKEIQLTLIDRQILNSYNTLLEGLETYLGSGYEIVLHSLESFDHSVINIVNGEHTGRKIGAPITDRALEMLNRLKNSGESSETYFSTNAKGEPLKSTTIAIRGENDRIIGLLCINYYMNISFNEFIQSFIPKKQKEVTSKPVTETFAKNVDETILATLEYVKKEVYSDSSITYSNKNKAIISTLYNKGIFQIKDSVSKIAEDLGISKNTVYLHLRNLSSQDN